MIPIHQAGYRPAMRPVVRRKQRQVWCQSPHQLRDIVDVLLEARPNALSIVGANGRHEHEWKVCQEVKLPAGKVLIPRVIDSTTNIIEHPEVVADRLMRYATVLGRENIIAGVDCGFGTNACTEQVDPEVAWAKLEALVQGAELASKALWG